jgi:hypothetical protein
VGSLERRLEALEEAPARYPYGRGGTPMGGAVPLWAPLRTLIQKTTPWNNELVTV